MQSVLNSKVEVANPVDEVEEAKSDGEENTRVGVQLGYTDMQPALSPAVIFTLIEAAEEC